MMFGAARECEFDAQGRIVLSADQRQYAGITAVAFLWLFLAHRHPYDMLISSTLLGLGIGMAFAALGNLVVQAVPAYQTGVASGMNTVMRTLGGALGGQISATQRLPKLDQAIPLVVSGGTAMPKGFLEQFTRALRASDFPVPLSDVRLSADALNSTARGALMAALC